MSLNLLTVPNDYNLYCNSITQADPDVGNTPKMISIVIPAQNLVVSPAITIVSMTVRGVPTTPPLAGAVTLVILEDAASTLVTLTIPSFLILNATGAVALSRIGILAAGSIPVQYRPQFPTYFMVSVFLNNPAPPVSPQVISTQTGPGLLIILGDGSVSLQPIQTSPNTFFSVGSSPPVPCGITGDICVTYCPSAIE